MLTDYEEEIQQALDKVDELAHHGIEGQHWGKKNGPPYPLSYNDHTPEQKKHLTKEDYDKETGLLKSKNDRDREVLNSKKTANDILEAEKKKFQLEKEFKELKNPQYSKKEKRYMKKTEALIRKTERLKVKNNYNSEVIRSKELKEQYTKYTKSGKSALREQLSKNAIQGTGELLKKAIVKVGEAYVNKYADSLNPAQEKKLSVDFDTMVTSWDEGGKKHYTQTTKKVMK